MFEEKYGVTSDKIKCWLGLYMMLGVAGYYILYEINPIYVFIILIIENITTYRLLDDDFIDEALEEEESGKSTIVFIIGSLVGLISLGVLFFINLWLFIILLVVEILFVGIKKCLK